MPNPSLVVPVIARRPSPYGIGFVGGPWGAAIRERGGSNLIVADRCLLERAQLRFPHRHRAPSETQDYGLSASADGRIVSATSGGALLLWSSNESGEWYPRPRVIASAGVEPLGHAVAGGDSVWYVMETSDPGWYRLHATTLDATVVAVADTMIEGTVIVPIPGAPAVLVTTERTVGPGGYFSVARYDLVEGAIRATHVFDSFGCVTVASMVSRSGRIALAIDIPSSNNVLDVLDLGRGTKLSSLENIDPCCMPVMCGESHAAFEAFGNDKYEVRVVGLSGPGRVITLEFEPALEFETVELLGTLQDHELVFLLDNGREPGELCVADVSAALVDD